MALQPQATGQSARGTRHPFPLVLWLLIAVASALFLTRGLGRMTSAGLADFAAPYAGARLLIAGENPYDSHRLAESLLAAGATNPEHTVAVYPPGSLAAMLPFAPFSARPARILMVVAGLGLLAYGSWRWMGLLAYSRRKCIVASCLLVACAPLHTAMVVSNPVLLAAGALLAGSALLQAGAHRRGLLLLGLSIVLKPQVGFVGPLWLMLSSFMRPVFFLTCMAGGLHWVVAAALFFHRPAAWFDWLANLHAETVAGSISAEAQLGFQRIDPAGVWFAVTGIGLPWSASLLLAGGFVLRMVNTGRGDDPALPQIQIGRLGVAAITLLLAGYHRGYDALMLIPLWLLILSNRFSFADRPRVLIGMLSLLWILPGAGFWLMMESRFEVVKNTLAPSFFWMAGLVRLHGWTMLMTAVLVAIFPLTRLVTIKPHSPDEAL